MPLLHVSLEQKPDSTLVEGGGFEPPKLARQIYSLIPLATQEPLPKEALDSAFESMQCQTKLMIRNLALQNNSLQANARVSLFLHCHSALLPLVPPPRVELGTY